MAWRQTDWHWHISSHVISPGFVAASFRVVQNWVYLHDHDMFPLDSSGCLNYAHYEIFKYSEDDILSLHVYHGTYCGIPATVHYIRKSDFAKVAEFTEGLQYKLCAIHQGIIAHFIWPYDCLH
ncbi:unnamed protein product [Prunus armeniaca]|uniref:Uncharacterized protein n=1 Tax=Prunus armeniaca TaxID=36596 RepID=A0A6J5UYJ5_PRUAR|nr:unnamed protein product [Prunus armeniaca]CAB4310639.1 unnamed protein product [Prunus armeniaca]